jgi:ketosteroid isomerase-like protein
MADLAPLTEDEVTEFVRAWYLDLLDIHAPVDRLLSQLDGENVVMRLPEVTLQGLDAFKDWYQRIVTTFFDEVHDIKELSVSVDGDRASVKLLVNWQAKVWVPPAAKSQWIGFDAAQTWDVRRSPTTGKPVIVVYGVDKFTPMANSSNLPVMTREVIGLYYQAINAKDFDACEALLADDVTFSDQAWGNGTGAGKVRELAENAISELKSFQLLPQQFIVQGTSAVALWNLDAVDADGADIRAHGVTVVEVNDGKITSIRMLFDPTPRSAN